MKRSSGNLEQYNDKFGMNLIYHLLLLTCFPYDKQIQTRLVTYKRAMWRIQ